jgi:hypothetical protein
VRKARDFVEPGIIQDPACCRLCRYRHNRHTFATELLAQGAPITYVAAQLGHTKPTTTLQWYAHWLPRGDKHWVDALDRAESQARGSKLVANSTELDASVVEVVERLEPTIGLEPMTCRLRRDGFLG